MSKLYLVGIGPGSSEYLTPIAKKAVESSDILIGSKRSLDLFRDVKAEKIELSSRNIEKMMKFAISKVTGGKCVSLLSTGDPGFSGILKHILKVSGDVDMEVIPGISSIQLCAAKLQIPWDDANLITLHGRGISNEILEIIEDEKPTIILPNFKPNEIASFLIENGVDPKREVAICEKLSYDDERILKTTLNGVLEEKFSYMCVMVIY